MSDIRKADDSPDRPEAAAPPAEEKPQAYALTRRSFLKTAGLGLAAAGLAPWLLPAVAERPAGAPAPATVPGWAPDRPVRLGPAVPSHLLLTWTGDPARTQTIRWRSDTSVTAGTVLFQAGSALTGAAESVPAAASDLTTELGTSRLFTATLTGLAPHTRYTYRVGNGSFWSQPHSFTTADPQAPSFSFLIFGDSQSGCPETIYEPWSRTLHNAVRAYPEAKFVMNVGDLVEIGQSGAQWEGWFAGAQGVIDTLPQMAVQGNHETYPLHPDPNDPDQKRALPSKPSLWLQQFPLPQNGPAALKGQVYSFDYGPVHFVVLDSQIDEEQGNILERQQPWLEADLAASRAPWKFAFFHKTPYDLKAHRPNPLVKAAFCPIFDKYHVDVVFNGHDHGLARTYALHHDTPMARPSQGTIYYVTGRSGNKTYPDLSKKPLNTWFYDPQDQPVYLVATVAGTTLTVKSVKQDGTVLDSFNLDKAADTDSDAGVPLPAPAVAS
jgi:hypothetical protein